MKVYVELHNKEKRTYDNVTRVDKGSEKVTVYDEGGVLAIIDINDLKNLLSENNDS